MNALAMASYIFRKYKEGHEMVVNNTALSLKEAIEYAFVNYPNSVPPDTLFERNYNR